MPTSSQSSFPNGTWTCPANVTSVDVRCWGGGGGTDGSDGTAGAGGGAFSRTPSQTVTPGGVYAVTVGAGGTGGIGINGGDSTFAGPADTSGPGPVLLRA